MGSPRTFIDKLARSIEGEARFDSASIAVYSHDASNYRQVPVGVVIPRTAEDVAIALALARDESVPIVARGGGTSLGGQATGAALVIDFSKYMNRIVNIDPGRRLVTVEPGVVQNTLNLALAKHGLFFAPDPSTKDRCTIGGMIGNNSCGAHSAAYGKTVDNLESIDAVLYDGTRLRAGAIDETAMGAAQAGGGREAALYAQLDDFRNRWGNHVRNGFPKLPRRVSGYNLDELLPENGFNLARALVGSEGTCAITTAATMRVVPRPRAIALAVLGFDDVFAAADQVAWILSHRPEALEGFDEKLPEFAKLKKMEGVRLLPAGRAFLIVELGGDSAEEANGRAQVMLSRSRQIRECTGAVCLTDAREQSAVWNIRASGLGSGAYIPGNPRTWPGAEDTAVPPEKLGAYLRRFAAVLARNNLHAATYYGHFGEGCVHMRIDFDLASERGVKVFRNAMEQIADLVGEFGGSLSGEHGDGIARSELLPRIFEPKLIEAFSEFKRIFDPERRMNPGVLADPYPIDSHLKLGPSYRPAEIATHFDLSADGGLAGAVLKCVGIGKCRKLDGGTMCPSYMATHEEIHSTRGRARILFEALNGGLKGGFTDDAVHEALDLCLSCKGCKTECPASVDMATYKAEFLAHYHETHRRTPAAQLFGRIHEFARFGSRAPRIANALARAPIAARLAKSALGIHPERELPRIAKTTFKSWFAARAHEPVSGAREVVLFPDTFNNYFEPEVAIAATEVLERAGFAVAVPERDLCCGRPLYDQGMLERARRRLFEVMEALEPYLRRGAYVVGLEPSCILTFRDELPALFPGDERAGALRDRALLLDEFLAREAPDFVPPALRASVLVHGHCHQKAIAGMSCESALLRRAEGIELEVLDAGCCGMAGPFGYETAHFEVSKACAERVLVPAIKRSGADTVVIADGFSCRTQIRHFCPDRKPIHLAQALNLSAS